MKKYLALFIAILITSGVVMSCKKKATQTESTDNIQANTRMLSLDETIGQYLTDSIGSRYSEGEVCIPVVTIIDLDSTDVADIKAWGDYWVFNYNVSGDTLKTVSGGNHPGMFHLRKTLNGFEVTAFDQVEDGSAFMPSAKRIYGDKFDAFLATNSDENKRDELRKAAIAHFVKQNSMPVTLYQDYGWPAKEIE